MNRSWHSLARKILLPLVTFFFLTAFQTQAAGVPPWVGWVVIIILVLLLLWFIFRDQQAAPTATRAALGPAARVPDDLTIIEGIGPKIASVLQQAGITTFKQLAATDVSHLRQILEQNNLRLADPGSWAEQARLADAGDTLALQALQDRLKGGRSV